MDNNELYHYGVLGMKWGVRKDRGGDSSKRSLGNRYHSSSARRIQRDADDLRKHGYTTEADAVQKVADKQKQKAINSQRKADSKRFRTNMKERPPAHDDYKKAHSKKPVREMSDAELRERINRLDMEKRYRDLEPGTKNRGKRYINSIIKTGTTVATLTGTALTIYNNADKIRKLVK